MNALLSESWNAGLINQTRREAGMWWTTGRWWRQAVMWTVILNGLLAAILWVFPQVLATVEGGVVAPLDVTEGAAQFAELAGVVSAIGVVILTQGVLLDDRRHGLIEWLLSKPLSRPALILAKLAGHGSGLLVSMVIVPWVGTYLLLSVASGQAWPVARFLGAVSLIGLFVLFHLSLVLALSTIFRGRGPVLAIPLALLVGSDLVMGVFPWTASGMPYLLNQIAAVLLAIGPVAEPWPVLATVVWTTTLTGVAVWRFTRSQS